MTTLEPDHVAMADRTDDDLIIRAIGGELPAFETLYQRHADSAWRLAQSVTRNADDASDAVAEAFTKIFTAVQDGRFPVESPFKPYLLAATRNAAIDQIRKTGRLKTTDSFDHFEQPQMVATPQDSLDQQADGRFAVEAFRTLPARWRSVLWLTEVEGLAPREAAAQLGLNPNSTAQLAVRARAGLRSRYLQAHLRTADNASCRFTIDRLGAYVAGDISARDLAKVDQHLAACDSCRDAEEELRDIGQTLRRRAIPLPIVLSGATWGMLKAAGLVGAVAIGGAKAGGTVVSFIWRQARNRAVQTAAGVTTAAAVTAAALGIAPGSGSQDTTTFENAASPPPAQVAEPEVEPEPEPEPVVPSAPRASLGGMSFPTVDGLAGDDDAGDSSESGDADGVAAEAAPEPVTTPGDLLPTAPPPPNDPPQEPAEETPAVSVDLGVNLGGESIGLHITDDPETSGVQVGPVVLGEEPPENTETGDTGVSISTGGTLVEEGGLDDADLLVPLA